MRYFRWSLRWSRRAAAALEVKGQSVQRNSPSFRQPRFLWVFRARSWWHVKGQVGQEKWRLLWVVTGGEGTTPASSECWGVSSELMCSFLCSATTPGDVVLLDLSSRPGWGASACPSDWWILSALLDRKGLQHRRHQDCSKPRQLSST